MAITSRHKIRLWTIQPIAVWEQLQRDGVLLVDESRLGEDLPASYQWLRQNLSKVIPGYRGGLPWWFYCQKPDLRVHRHFQFGQQVRLELEVNTGHFFIMPSWAWDRVYAQDYLAKTWAEWRNWHLRLRLAVADEDLWPLPEPWHTELVQSWHRLFHPDLPPKPIFRYGLSWLPGLEAVSERLKLTEVKQVAHFTGVRQLMKRSKKH